MRLMTCHAWLRLMLDGPVLCICLTATVGRHAWSWDLLVIFLYVDRLLRVMTYGFVLRRDLYTLLSHPVRPGAWRVALACEVPPGTYSLSKTHQVMMRGVLFRA